MSFLDQKSIEIKILNKKLMRMEKSFFRSKNHSPAMDVVACLPDRGTPEYDLMRSGLWGHAALLDADSDDYSISLFPNGILKVPLGFAQHIKDPGFTALLIPKTNLSTKNVILSNSVAVIDPDYQGQNVAIIWNRHPINNFVVKDGSVIAQMIYIPVVFPIFDQVDEFSEKTDKINEPIVSS